MLLSCSKLLMAGLSENFEVYCRNVLEFYIDEEKVRKMAVTHLQTKRICQKW